MEEVNCYKVVMLGDSGVGKTSLVNQITENIFSESHIPTVGSQFTSFSYEIDKKKLTFELWDIAGQEVYRSLVSFYTRESKGAFLVFDVTNQESFNGLQEWINFVEESTPGVHIILFANKCDLEEQRKVSKESLSSFALQHKLHYFEGSAKTGQEVSNAFDQMAEILISLGENNSPTNVIEINSKENNKNNKRQCCK
ncbi:small GTP-binding protein [Tritrichomonas foetus]|uniref:Small GTP-binding protein n=1 Tax=Tritrichomonas foetus TaxID=1144522 RepID=A0A1J4K2T5_9EUKA|nr:small GTP-binding protein [Tritrichomonas foetus]|eukprot:OHT04046.1 small GTP-binding protein [Tritrichomonas foetus]